MMRDGVQFDPVVVFKGPSIADLTYWLAHGFHRVAAAKRAGIKTIPVEIHYGTKRDALLWSLCANQKHGVQLTKGDKKKIIQITENDEEWRRLPDTQLHDLIGISRQYIGVVRRELRTKKTPALVAVQDSSGSKSGTDIQSSQDQQSQQDTETVVSTTGEVSQGEVVLENENSAETTPATPATTGQTGESGTPTIPDAPITTVNMKGHYTPRGECLSRTPRLGVTLPVTSKLGFEAVSIRMYTALQVALA